jgi:alanyl-tRNA synthetase
VAAGVRRIEAFTGQGAWEHQHARNVAFDAVLASLNAQPDSAVATIEKLQHDVKRLTREVSELKVKAAMGGGTAADDSIVIGVTKVIARRVADLDKAALRALSDSLRDQAGAGVVVIANEADGKVGLLVAVSKDLTSKVQAGAVVREIAPIVGGGGGGRPDFAEAGGKDPSRIDEALAASRTLLTRLLS